MKFCPVDRWVNADDAPRCRNCGHVFRKGRKDLPASTLSRMPGEKAPPAKTRSRAEGVEIERLGSPALDAPVLQLIDAAGFALETFRLQAEPRVLGRAEGLVTFPEDDWMSPAHASLRSDGRQAFLRDLKSQAGTFLRAERVELFEGLEVLVGRTTLRFAPAGGGWQVTLRGPEGKSRVVAVEAAFGIGRKGQDVALEDPSVSPLHAKVRGGVLADAGSLNGIYYRLPAQRNEVLEPGGMFRAGRQVFRFALPGR